MDDHAHLCGLLTQLKAVPLGARAGHSWKPTTNRQNKTRSRSSRPDPRPPWDAHPAALVNKETRAHVRKLIEKKIWDEHENVFVDAFYNTVQECGFTTWNGKLEANLHTWKFSVRLFDTFYAGTTITSRLTDTPDVRELVAHYGVEDTDATTATFLTTVPAVQYLSDWRIKDIELYAEKQQWVRQNSHALRVFLAEQHRLRVSTIIILLNKSSQEIGSGNSIV
jgi:hypothetical protein